MEYRMYPKNLGSSEDIEVFEMEAGELLTHDLNKIIQKKPKESLGKDTKNIMAVIAMNYDNLVPFGSWTYKSQLYPGDIDLIEEDSKCCNKEDALKFFVKSIQRIVKKIKNTRKVYLGDIKAGIDYRFKLNIGKVKYTGFNQGNIIGYNYLKTKDEVKNLYNNKLLSKQEFAEINKLVKPNLTVEEFETLYDLLRDKWLLRWSYNEIMDGYKILIGDLKMPLIVAINQPTMTKIDIWTNLRGRFIEVTNVYSLYYEDKKGNRELLNFTNNIINLQEDLKKEVAKYAFSKKYFKPFKMVKRMWSISRMTKDLNLTNFLTTFMQSDIGRLSQITSDLETIVSVLENVKNPPISSILTEIDNMKERFSNIYEIDINSENAYHIFDSILRNKKKVNKKNLNKIIILIEGLIKYFKVIINENTINYLENNNLYPPPPNLLPK